MQFRSPHMQVYIQVIAFFAIAVAVLAAIIIADNSRAGAENAKTSARFGALACAYQLRSYPSARTFRETMKTFVNEVAARLEREQKLAAKVSRAEAGLSAVAIAAIAAEKGTEAVKARRLAKAITIPPRPRCRSS